MARGDITENAVSGASEIVFKAEKALATLIPLGPGKVEMTNAEFQTNLKGMKGNALASLLEQQVIDRDDVIRAKGQ
jgi:hypothetical protein